MALNKAHLKTIYAFFFVFFFSSIKISDYKPSHFEYIFKTFDKSFIQNSISLEYTMANEMSAEHE